MNAIVGLALIAAVVAVMALFSLVVMEGGK